MLRVILFLPFVRKPYLSSVKFELKVVGPITLLHFIPLFKPYSAKRGQFEKPGVNDLTIPIRYPI